MTLDNRLAVSLCFNVILATVFVFLGIIAGVQSDYNGRLTRMLISLPCGEAKVHSWNWDNDAGGVSISGIVVCEEGGILVKKKFFYFDRSIGTKLNANQE